MEVKVFVADSIFHYYLKNKKLIYFPIILGLFTNDIIKIFNFNFKTNIDLENLILMLMKSFIDYLIYSNSNIYVYFFNLSSSIGYSLIKYLYVLYPNLNIIMRKGIIYSIKINFNNNIIHIKNFNLTIPFSIGDSVFLFNKFAKNTKQKNISFTLDLLIIFQDFLELYLKDRLFILSELFINYSYFLRLFLNISIYNILTLSGLSKFIYFKDYFKYQFKGLSLIQEDYIRRSYFGGINDIYIPYGSNVVMLDFNNMYSNIMKNTKFPLGLPKFTLSVDGLKEFCLEYSAFIYVEIFCDEDLEFPLIMLNHNHSSIQPVGYFRQVVWSKEILYCLENYPTKYQFKVISALYFKETDFIFEEFIDNIYNMKLKYEPLNQFLTLFIHSLYGTLGMIKDSNFTNIINIFDENNFVNRDDIDINTILILNDHFSLINYNENNKSFNNSKLRIDWASIITSEARILIQRLKDLVDIYYIDTDSLIISVEDLPNLLNFIDKFSLGYLKIVGYYDECIFITSKIYLLRNGLNFFVNFKGFNQDVSTLSDDDLYTLFKLSLDNDKDLLNNQSFKNFLDKNFSNFLFTYSKRLKEYDNMR